MKNKRLALLIAGIASVSMLFSACNSNNDTESEVLPEETTAVAETSEIVATQPPADQLMTEEAVSSEEITESKLFNAVEKVTADVEWAQLDRISDPDIMNEFFKLDADNENYNDILVMQCPMSAVIAEIILIEAKDGQVDTAKADLEARKEKLINVDAFYPDSKTIAEDSIVGVYNNIAYFIAGENAAESEQVLLKELENQGY